MGHLLAFRSSAVRVCYLPSQKARHNQSGSFSAAASAPPRGPPTQALTPVVSRFPGTPAPSQVESLTSPHRSALPPTTIPPRRARREYPTQGTAVSRNERRSQQTACPCRRARHRVQLSLSPADQQRHRRGPEAFDHRVSASSGIGLRRGLQERDCVGGLAISSVTPAPPPRVSVSARHTMDERLAWAFQALIGSRVVVQVGEGGRWRRGRSPVGACPGPRFGTYSSYNCLHLACNVS